MLYALYMGRINEYPRVHTLRHIHDQKVTSTEITTIYSKYPINARRPSHGIAVESVWCGGCGHTVDVHICSVLETQRAARRWLWLCALGGIVLAWAFAVSSRANDENWEHYTMMAGILSVMVIIMGIVGWYFEDGVKVKVRWHALSRKS